MCVRNVPEWRSREAFICEVVNVKSGLWWRPYDIGDTRVREYLLRRELEAAEERLQSSRKLGTVGDRKTTLTLGVEIKNLKFVLLFFILILLQ